MRRLPLVLVLMLAACTPVQFKGTTLKKKKASPAPSEQEKTNPSQPIQTAEQPSNDPSHVKPPAVSPEAPSATTPVPLPPEAPAPIIPVATGFIGAPIIGIINMDSKYQITNEGYRISVEQNGEVIASGPMNLLSIMNGEPVDMQGSANGKPFLTKSVYAYVNPKVASGSLSGNQKATVSICMPQDVGSAYDKPIKCRDLNPYVGHSNGSNTFIGATSDIEIKNNNVVVKAMYNTKSHGGCGTSKVPCASVMHPIFGFAAKSNYFGNDNASPLVLDLNKNQKLDLISVWNKSVFVYFAMGKTKDKVRSGWVSKEDGLLVMDVNQNGKIDDSSELFGEFSANAKQEKFDNGYLALAQYDSNADLLIDDKDKMFSKLRIWQDRNSDGKSDGRELFTLFEKKIKSIDLHYTPANPDMTPTVELGNEIRFVSTYTSSDGKPYMTGDVWFELRLGRKVADILNEKRSK